MVHTLLITHCLSERHSVSTFHSIRPQTGSSEERKELSLSLVSWLLSLSKEGIWDSVSLLVRCRVSPALSPSQGSCGNQAELERSRVCIEDLCLPRWPGIQILFLFEGQREESSASPTGREGAWVPCAWARSPCSANTVPWPNTGIVEWVMSRGRGRSERILVAVGPAGRGGSRTGHSMFYPNSWLPGFFPTFEPASPRQPSFAV